MYTCDKFTIHAHMVRRYLLENGGDDVIEMCCMVVHNCTASNATLRYIPFTFLFLFAKVYIAILNFM